MAVSGVVRGVQVGDDSTDRPPGPIEMVVLVGGVVENCRVSSLTWGYTEMHAHMACPPGKHIHAHGHTHTDTDTYKFRSKSTFTALNSHYFSGLKVSSLDSWYATDNHPIQTLQNKVVRRVYKITCYFLMESQKNIW